MYPQCFNCNKKTVTAYSWISTGVCLKKLHARNQELAITSTHPSDTDPVMPLCLPWKDN